MIAALLYPQAIAKQLEWQGILAFLRQQVNKKENTKFKPVSLR